MLDFQGTGLLEEVQEWVRENPEPSALDEAAINRFICEEWECLTVYTSDMISLWVEFGTPTCNTQGFLDEHGDIISAIRQEVWYAFTAKAYHWCSEYMHQLRKGL